MEERPLMAGTIVPAVPPPALCIPDIGPRKKGSALLLMLGRAREAGALRQVESVHDALMLRERVASTAVGKGVAVPNARALAVLEPCWVLGRSERGIDWDAPDGLPAHLILLVLTPPDAAPGVHLDAVARAMSLTRLARGRARLLEARDADEMTAVLRAALPFAAAATPAGPA
jgi:mannitol/fructose-specific phosphotransferase system IIA component (Ntr-type)